MLLNAQEIERRRWLRRNRGVLQRIAKDTEYGRTMVSLVFNKHRGSIDGSIEAALTDAKAPGWGEKKPARKA